MPQQWKCAECGEHTDMPLWNCAACGARWRSRKQREGSRPRGTSKKPRSRREDEARTLRRLAAGAKDPEMAESFKAQADEITRRRRESQPPSERKTRLTAQLGSLEAKRKRLWAQYEEAKVAANLLWDQATAADSEKLLLDEELDLAEAALKRERGRQGRHSEDDDDDMEEDDAEEEAERGRGVTWAKQYDSRSRRHWSNHDEKRGPAAPTASTAMDAPTPEPAKPAVVLDTTQLEQHMASMQQQVAQQMQLHMASIQQTLSLQQTSFAEQIRQEMQAVRQEARDGAAQADSVAQQAGTRAMEAGSLAQQAGNKALEAEHLAQNTAAAVQQATGAAVQPMVQQAAPGTPEGGGNAGNMGITPTRDRASSSRSRSGREDEGGAAGAAAVTIGDSPPDSPRLGEEAAGSFRY